MVTARRATQWYEILQGESSRPGATQFNFDLLSNISIGNRTGSTVTRLIMDMLVHPSVASGVNEVFFGVVVANADALAAGATPDPEQVDDADWLVHGRLFARGKSNADDLIDDRVRLDIRSQRKLRNVVDRLVLCCHVQTASAIDYSHLIRTLMKHP